MGDMSED
jgi:hypothetical protein